MWSSNKERRHQTDGGDEDRNGDIYVNGDIVAAQQNDDLVYANMMSLPNVTNGAVTPATNKNYDEPVIYSELHSGDVYAKVSR